MKKESKTLVRLVRTETDKTGRPIPIYKLQKIERVKNPVSEIKKIKL